jgi:hypothetical protein
MQNKTAPMWSSRRPKAGRSNAFWAVFTKNLRFFRDGARMPVLTKETMSGQKKTRKPVGKALPYPDKTVGSEVAAEVREEANNWSDAKREDLFRKGMQIIYGGSGPKQTVRPRH